MGEVTDHAGMMWVSELEFNVPFQHKHGYIRDDWYDVRVCDVCLC